MDNIIDSFVCSKCNGTFTFIKNNSTQTGLYCSKCGKWIKWLSKEEIRLYENKMELDSTSDLSNFTNEELLNEIKRRMN